MGSSLIKFNFFFYHRRILWLLLFFRFRFFRLIIRFDINFIQQLNNLLVVSKSFSCDVYFLLSLHNLLKVRGVLNGFWRSLRLGDLSWRRHKPLLLPNNWFFITCVNILLLRMPVLTLNWGFITNRLLRSLILL